MIASAGVLYQATADWTASYDDPIKVKKGEPLTLTGRSDVWDGHQWLWAKNDAGKEGWVPDTLLASGVDTVSTAHALHDFNATELSCRRGETLLGLQITHGWVLCQSKAGQQGWVPEKILRTK